MTNGRLKLRRFSRLANHAGATFPARARVAQLDSPTAMLPGPVEASSREQPQWPLLLLASVVRTVSEPIFTCEEPKID